MFHARKKKRTQVVANDDDDDSEASVDTRQTKQSRTAHITSALPHHGDAAAEEEQEEAATPLKLHNNGSLVRQNMSWHGARSNRPCPSASADEMGVPFLPPFRRGIRFLEISKHPAFFGRTDGIVGGWADPPSDRLARWKSNSMKQRQSLKLAFIQCRYFTEDDRKRMLDCLSARYRNASAARKLNVSLPDMVNIVHDVLLPEMMIELIIMAFGGKDSGRDKAIEFLKGKLPLYH
jgi:hypothetical protein